MDKNIYNITVRCDDVLKLSKRVSRVCGEHAVLYVMVMGLAVTVIGMAATVRNQQIKLWELEGRINDETYL